MTLDLVQIPIDKSATLTLLDKEYSSEFMGLVDRNHMYPRFFRGVDFRSHNVVSLKIKRYQSFERVRQAFHSANRVPANKVFHVTF